MQTTTIYTTSSDLTVNADLCVFHGSPEELLAHLKRKHDDIEDIEAGDFGDCWLKRVDDPREDGQETATFDGIECRVQPPGSHPGGNFYWCTPVQPVFVVKYKAAD